MVILQFHRVVVMAEPFQVLLLFFPDRKVCQLIVSGLIAYMCHLCNVVLMCYSVSVLCSTRYYPLPSCPILASFYAFITHVTHMSHLRHPLAVNLFSTKLFGETQHRLSTLPLACLNILVSFYFTTSNLRTEKVVHIHCKLVLPHGA